MRLNTNYIQGLITGGALALTVPLLAGVDLPNTFEPGTTASAEQVNANFNALAERVEAMEMFVSDLETYMEVTENGQGMPVIRISGANVHINNGDGATDSINGTGNLIIGYDEARSSGDAVCSNGGFDNQGDCESNGHVWAINHKSGSHNLVIGSQHNYSRYASLVAGETNTVNGDAAAVSGGTGNVASGAYTSVSGGRENTASVYGASVSGGRENVAGSSYASVSGGWQNLSNNNYTSVSGGFSCTADGGLYDWAAPGNGC